MQINFNKYQGAGNDFILVDNRGQIIQADNSELIKRMCDRHFGIGADGLILLDDHQEQDFEMKYFNSDGRESSMCGNGGRCAVAFARKAGFIDDRCEFMAIDGIHSGLIKDNLVEISMSDVAPPSTIDGSHFLNTGSPHYIIYVPDNKKINVVEKGREIRWSDKFAPHGTNVNFVENTEEGIFVRTYERGVENETLSCGTGVTAAAISSKWGEPHDNYNVKVKTNGGELLIKFRLLKDKACEVFLTGPAEFVFSGSFK